MSRVGESFLDGRRVVGMYMGEYPVSGIVRLSRVKYGGGMSHHVTLNSPIKVYGAVRESIILDASEIKGVL
jgi:hypothetical protein